jgi:S-adenosylmethionine:tRNA ribosyltransferase-isomerase
MKTSDFDYNLPPELIAQTPIEPRSQSRLLVVDRSSGSLEHRRFYEIIDFLRQGDVLVFNDSRVIPARLKGIRSGNEGKAEILLLTRLGPGLWETLVKPGRRIRAGTIIEITGNSKASVTAEVISEGEGGSRVIKFSDESLLPELGEIPLPPYIHAHLDDPGRYQTVYADAAGSVAAPTAGLHFTPELIDKIKARGVRCVFTTLHIGLDTFRPVHEDDPSEHKIHLEYGVLSQQSADELSLAKREGRRIICVGTTAVRLVEAVARDSDPQHMQGFSGWVDLFILPGHNFRAVDTMITNFHLPKSTLLMLVTAFAGKELLSKAYLEAIENKYRFYSFGDAMLIL